MKKKSKVMALSGHFDLPARGGVLKQVIYVGHDSCSYCDEHGETVKTGTRGHVMTFPFRNTASGHMKLRVAEEVKAYSHDALERNTTVSSFFSVIDCKLSWPVITDFLISSQYEALPQVLKSLVPTFCQGNTYSRHSM